MATTAMGARKTRQAPQYTTTNRAGHGAFEQDLKARYVQTLLTNVATNTFYATAQENRDSALEIHQQMAEADPYFMAQALVYARNEGHMRLQPIVGLAVLSKYSAKLAGRIFSKIIYTPGDLADLFSLCLNTPEDHICHRNAFGNKNTGFARHIANYLLNLSEYHVIKYQAGGQVFPLRDMLRIIRPKPVNTFQEYLFHYVVDREGFGEVRWMVGEMTDAEYEVPKVVPQIAAFEYMKVASTDEEAIQHIAEGRLPHEVVTGARKMTPALWKALIPQLPYFALLRNLVTLMKNNAITDQETATFIADKLANKYYSDKAGVLPFQIKAALNKFQQYSNAPFYGTIVNGLQTAFENSVSNIPTFKGKVCIAPDISGSMASQLTNGEMMYCDVSAIFAGAIFKQNPDALILPFNTDVQRLRTPLNSRDSLWTLTNILSVTGGGTRLSAPLQYLLDNKIKVDYFISFTDSEEWVGSSFFSVWQKYRTFSPNTKVFLVRMDTSGTIPTPPVEKNVYHIYGWGDSVLKTIARLVEDNTSQVQAVSALEI